MGSCSTPSEKCLLFSLTAALLALSLAANGQATKTAANFANLSTAAQKARDADHLDEAARLYRQALALKPDWAEGWWSLGTLDYDRDRYREAAESFRKLAGLQPNSGMAHVMLGLCQFELGQDDAALQALKEGSRLGLSPDPQLRTVVLFHEGVLLQRKGRFESAEETLGQLCRQSPYPPEVDPAMGAIALRVRNPQLPAEGTADHQVMQAAGKATCLGLQRKYEEAGREFNALLAAHPNYPGLHSAYGKVLLEANDTDAAVTQFQAELANYPKDANAMLRIASAKYRIDSAGGLPYAEQAVKLDPGLPLGHYLLGLLLLDTDDYQRAIPELEIARDAFPDQPKVYFALASAYSRAGRKEDADRARQKFLQLNQQQESNPSAAEATAPVSPTTNPPR